MLLVFPLLFSSNRFSIESLQGRRRGKGGGGEIASWISDPRRLQNLYFPSYVHRNIKVSKYKYGHITSLDLKKKCPHDGAKAKKNQPSSFEKDFTYSPLASSSSSLPSELEAASFKIQEGVNHWWRKDSLSLSLSWLWAVFSGGGGGGGWFGQHWQLARFLKARLYLRIKITQNKTRYDF